MDACFIFLEADLMSADSSRFQSEADNVIRKYFENENELLDVKPEHGIPFRVDVLGNKNNWKFNDRFTLSLEARK